MAIRIQSAFCSAVSLFVITTLCGCSGGVEDRPTIVPVSGSVMYNGEVVVGATVSFWTKGAGRAATGVTNAEGKFQLTMFDPNDGAIPGEHKITVSKIEAGAAPAADPTAVMNDPAAMANMAGAGADGAANKGPKSLVPAKYGNQNSTPLQETVAASGENKFALQLAD